MVDMRFGGLFLLLLLLPSPLGAQDEPLPSSTYARRGLVIGGVAGGAAGGLFVGLLAQGLCEYECDGAFWGGLALGGAGGAVLGGLTGLVIGAAIPRDSSNGKPGAGPVSEPDSNRAREGGSREAPGQGTRVPWTVRLSVGPGGPVHSERGGVDTWVSAAVLRSTSSRVRWGVELGYLGSRSQVDIFEIPITPADTAVITTTWDRTLWSASFMALRALGPDAHPPGYVFATAGVFPYRERVDGTRTGDPPDTPVRPPEAQESTRFLPGVGLGGGGRWPLGEWAWLGVDARMNLVLGAEDELGIGLASLGGVLWLGG